MEPTRASGLVDGPDHDPREREARQAVLLQIDDRLRPLADPEDIVFEAARLLGGHLGTDRVGYAQAQQDDETIVVTRNYTNGVPGIEGRYRYEDYGPELLREFRAGRTVVRGDIAGDPTLTDAEKAAHAVLRLGATINVPLMKAGRLVAVLFVHHREARSWTADELALVNAVADRTWAAVERARAEEGLRQSERRYRTLFESIDQGFCTIEVLFDDAGRSVDYRFLEVNPAFARNTGLEEAVGKRMRELRPAHEQFWFDAYGRIARTGVSERFEQLAHELGRWYSVYAYRVGEPELRRVAIQFEDITERKRADEAIRESRAELERQAQFLDATLSNVGDHIAIWDRQALFVYANRALESLWGRTRIDYAGKSTAELGYTQEQSAFFQESIAEVFRTKRVVRGEIPYTSPAGVMGYYEVVFSPVTGLGPRPEFVVGVARDITGRKHREARAAFLADARDDFARLTSPDDIMRAVGEKIYQHFSLDRLSFAYVDEAADTVTSIHDRHAEGLPPAERAIRLSDLVSDAFLRRLRTGQVYALHDVHTDRYAADRADAFKALDAGALLLAPFVSEGEWRFVIALQKVDPYNWRQAEIDLVQDLAPRLYLAIERARAGAAIRESEGRFRALANLVPDLLWSTDPDGHPSWYSQRLLDYTGQRREDLLTFGWLLVIHPDD